MIRAIGVIRGCKKRHLSAADSLSPVAEQGVSGTPQIQQPSPHAHLW